jgi:hypothetical protein
MAFCFAGDVSVSTRESVVIMGLFSKIREATGGDDPDLLANGQLGRAVVQNVTIKGMSVQHGALPPEQVCEFDLLVYLDDTPPFAAQAKKRIPVYTISQFVPGQTVVAVRVDRHDHAHVALDLSVDPPEVRMAAGSAQGSAAALLESGTPCEAVIVEYQHLGLKNPKGLDMYAFKLTILAEGAAPYQIMVGNPVPAEAIPLLYPGSKVPAKFDPNGPKESVAIDWTAAMGPVGSWA